MVQLNGRQSAIKRRCLILRHVDLKFRLKIIFPDQTNLPDRTDLTGQYQLTLSDRRCDLNNARWKVCISVCLSVCITVRLVVYSANLYQRMSAPAATLGHAEGGGEENLFDSI